MDASNERKTPTTPNPTRVERPSELEVVVTRVVNGPARLVFEAWTRPELFQRWWVPRSYGLHLVACELDVRVGGKYRLAFEHEGATMEFFGVYREVTPPTRLVWTNEEGDQGETITTVTFTEHAGKTTVVVHDRYPTVAAAQTGSSDAMPETLAQLDELLASLGAGGV